MLETLWNLMWLALVGYVAGHLLWSRRRRTQWGYRLWRTPPPYYPRTTVDAIVAASHYRAKRAAQQQQALGLGQGFADTIERLGGFPR